MVSSSRILAGVAIAAVAVIDRHIGRNPLPSLISPVLAN